MASKLTHTRDLLALRRREMEETEEIEKRFDEAKRRCEDLRLATVNAQKKSEAAQTEAREKMFEKGVDPEQLGKDVAALVAAAWEAEWAETLARSELKRLQREKFADWEKRMRIAMTTSYDPLKGVIETLPLRLVVSTMTAMYMALKVEIPRPEVQWAVEMALVDLQKMCSPTLKQWEHQSEGIRLMSRDIETWDTWKL